MELPIADWLIIVVTIIATIFGAFGGFSGAVSFFAGSCVSSIAGRIVWGMLADTLPVGWQRALASLTITLLIFGAVRYLVKKFVKGMLNQPADALFGMAVAAITGAAIAILGVKVVRMSEIIEVESRIVDKVGRLIPDDFAKNTTEKMEDSVNQAINERMDHGLEVER